MPMFTISVAAADIIEDNDRSANDLKNGRNASAIVPGKNVKELDTHHLLAHSASTSSNESMSNQLSIVNGTHPPMKRMMSAMPKLMPKLSIGQISAHSTQSFASTNWGETVHQGRWIDDKTACDHFTSLLSSVYGLLLTIFAMTLEMSGTFNAQEHIADIVFYAFMYGGALLFFAFWYLFVLYPGWFDLFQKILKKYGCSTSDKVWQIHIARHTHTGEGAGSLYLRLGAVCFGTVGIVYCGLEIFLCTRNNLCHSSEYKKYTLLGLFIFLQMHFIFCNSKVRINGSKNLAKFGTMHLVAVNLWTWAKYILAKQDAKYSRLAKDYYKNVIHESSSSDEFDVEDDSRINPIIAALKKAAAAEPSATLRPCLSANDFFGDAAILMTTGVVEFSIISAAVMFIMWKAIGTSDSTPTADRHGRKHRMRVDCSASSTGLFAGLLFLIAALVSIGVFSALSELMQNKQLQLVFCLSDTALLFISVIGCAFGLWRMRQLSYSHRGHGNAEVLDEVLLLIGLIEEVWFCSAGLLGWVGAQYIIQRQPAYTTFINVIRISQVLLQTVFILLSGRLRALGETAQQVKPGRQFVTFLLVANVTLFLFHALQGHRPDVSLLVVFYRFQSSVCLVEIWKHCYTFKESHSGHGDGQSIDQSRSLSRSTSVHTISIF